MVRHGKPTDPRQEAPADTSSPLDHSQSPPAAEVTQLLARIEAGEPSAPDEFLPLVYDELRKLAAARMAQERPGQTLQGTALVHEAYVRLVDRERAQHWNGRGHFFAAAAEAMRRILIEAARHKRSSRHGGPRRHIPLEHRCQVTSLRPDYRWMT